MNENIFITEKEAEELQNKIISMKGKSGSEILRFIVENLKSEKEFTLDKLKNGIDKNKVLAFVYAQEKLFKELVTIERKHREITYKYLPFEEKFKNEELEKITKIEDDIINTFNVLTSFLISYINDLDLLGKASPTIDRKIKGKIPKSKKPEQVMAEEYAIDIWKKDPSITQENMAYQLKDKLELPQTIQTIIRWIRPFQPKK
ncbi:hypothetical protein [Actinobacillus pleuropneumoniae]|uniref:hypothetical protein n=1 Tax=Actinobacillus pleuropneumoniae TaxID=715 RepID=UPI002279C8F2|nr:hypothetical protein [Actinobacillus pleuropneumoniae]MCY6395256.1 hypothetical protein [Actinobacillus pleuropneumoniae]MCY6409056.1 hypothetical protein [Actinobacillus pleuropneumoniae]MCY6429090.1 hypothetical protein [Actinobacillus pleuropneumoniae]